MIDWLRRRPEDLSLDIAGTRLPIALRRNGRAQRMTMRLAPDGSEIRITVPSWCRTQEALDFARSRQGWLESQLGQVPRVQAIGPGAQFTFRGDPVLVDWRRDAPRRPVLNDGALVLGGPEPSLPARLRRWLEQEALTLLEADLAHYCAQAGRDAPALSLSRAQRRWGSCSSNGTIRINWRLVQAPDPVRRSVVAHEVAHLVHFDHSPAFHALVDRIFEGDLPAADRWLKQHGRSLYAAFG